MHEGTGRGPGTQADQATLSPEGTHRPAAPYDTCDRRQVTQELEESKEQFEKVFDETPIGLALVDSDLRFVRVNQALCQMLGYSPEELTGLSFSEVTPPEDVHHDVRLTRKLFAGEMPGYSLEKRYLTKRGRVMWGHLTVSAMQYHSGSAPQVIAMVEDITDRKDAQTHLSHLALHDELTGLANRGLAMDRLHQAQARSQRSGKFMALLVLDLDLFNVVNDSLGHEAGDTVLAEIAWRLETVLRPSDTAARLDGDEFLVCCEDLGDEEGEAQARVIAVTERIAGVIAEPVEVEGQSLQVTTSIGIALTKGSQLLPEVILGHADAALFRAKERGRGRYEFFDDALRDRAAERAAIATELRAALERDELVVHYQPILDLRDGLIVGAEALVRWDHPERGLLLPEEFLEVAEETGLIVQVGARVLRRACEQLSVWRRTARDDLVVSVNASARQLGHHDLASSVAEVLDQTGLEPDALEIEISEAALVGANGPALSELEGLRDLGVHLGLDDFGTVQASLTSLQHLPVDFVKVDASFVAGLGVHEEDSAIVEAVVDMAAALGLQVVAEGVEVQAQEAALRTMGCGLGQGWHLGHPQTAASFTSLLASQPSAGQR